MLTSADITDADRRRNVRELADISDATFTDVEIDFRIKNADAVALSYFQVIDADGLDGTEPFFRNLVTVSNLIASVLIRQGLGGIDNTSVAKEQAMMYRSIVSAHNKKEPSQSVEGIGKTGGINNYQRGTFG
ncbi:MAG: hypothetical protein OXC46_03170 [Thaumarchaeota archaeon]|nr:hypothetical protein [Nitrososphaerota archaeon]